MSLKNLFQYGKMGTGLALAVSGISDDIEFHQSRIIAEEAFYRTLEIVTPETILKAKETLNTFMYNNSPIGDVVINVGNGGLIIVGTALVASGIYNLAKNYRKETKE